VAIHPIMYRKSYRKSVGANSGEAGKPVETFYRILWQIHSGYYVTDLTRIVQVL